MRSPLGVASLLAAAVCSDAAGQAAPDEATGQGAGASVEAEGAAEAEVLDVVARYFATYPAQDVETARAILHPAGVLFGRHYPNEGRDTPFIMGNAVWLEAMENWTQPNAEHLLSSSATVRGPVAAVWQSYRYEVDGKFSHCGVQNISLVRSNGVWRIVAMVWTVERSDCPT